MTNIELFYKILDERHIKNHPFIKEDGMIFIIHPKTGEGIKISLSSISNLFGTLTFLHDMSPEKAMSNIIDVCLGPSLRSTTQLKDE